MKAPLLTYTWPWTEAELAPFLRPFSKKIRPRTQYVPYRSTRQFEKALRETDALIVLLNHPITARHLAQAPRLKVLGTYSVGMNHIDLDACRAKKISVVNTPDVLTRATAELALTLLLSVARRIPEGEALCRNDRFRGWAPDLLLGLELQGRHAVLVGEGRIGQETAKLFQALGLTTEFITRKTPATEIRRKLKRAQVLSLHCPPTPDTHHWLNEQRLRLLPPDAMVINTARGEVIDEQALISCLKARRIFGAGLDVYEQEPKIPRSLRILPNVVLAPHLGSATSHTRTEMRRLVFEGVIRQLLSAQE